MEEEGPRGDMTIQSGLSNSTESIDSMKALTAAIEAANAQVSEGYHSFHVVVMSMFFPFIFTWRLYLQWTSFLSQVHGPASQHVNNSTISTPIPVLTRRPVVEDHRDDYRKEALRKGKCLSIGIQVFLKGLHTMKDTIAFTSSDYFFCSLEFEGLSNIGGCKDFWAFLDVCLFITSLNWVF